jgi:hypothetical protein
MEGANLVVALGITILVGLLVRWNIKRQRKKLFENQHVRIRRS